MAINANLLRRPNDRSLYLAAAILFPLLVLIGYFKSYYFNSFFPEARAIPNSLVHLHGIIMTGWVLYFVAQTVLIRTKNIKLHMTLGIAGLGLAILVIITGLAVAYDSHLVRLTAPPGMNPHGFFLLAVFDLFLFALFFGGAIYFRKKPAEHKTLMLMTAFNFLPAAFARIPLVPGELMIFWVFGMPDLLAIICLVWFSLKHRKFNKVFATAVLLLIVSQPLRIIFSFSNIWLDFVALIAP
jgi:hypothetical protein